MHIIPNYTLTKIFVKKFCKKNFVTNFLPLVMALLQGIKKRFGHRLNMELDIQSLFGPLCTAVLIG
jgi:hypothetical protein